MVDDLEYKVYTEQPRPTDEIVALIGELIDKVWYNRHKIYEEKIKAGEIKLRPYSGKYDPDGCDPEVWKRAMLAAKKNVEQYGLENLSPWDDFEWGMMNGKLPAHALPRLNENLLPQVTKEAVVAVVTATQAAPKRAVTADS